MPSPGETHPDPVAIGGVELEGLVISRIEPVWEGEQEFWESAKFFSAIKSREGEVYRWRRTTDDLHLLAEAGLFLPDLRCEAVTDPENPRAVILRYFLKPARALAGVEFDGNRAIGDEELRRHIGSRLKDFLTPHEADQVVRIIERAYRIKGYRFAYVVNPYDHPDSAWRELDDGRLQVTLRIIEGPKARYETVNAYVEGLPVDKDERAGWLDDGVPEHRRHDAPAAGWEQTLEAQRVLDEFFEIPGLWYRAMRWLWRKTTGSSPYTTQVEDFGKSTDQGTPLYNREEYRDQGVREQMLIIRDLLHQNGWLSAQVFWEKLAFSDDGDDVTLLLRVTPGRRFTYGSVTIESDPEETLIFTPEQIRAFITLKEGDFFSRARILGDGTRENRGDVNHIEQAFKREGYYYARVEAFEDLTPLPDESDWTGVVNLRLKIHQGRQVRVGRIVIQGNTRTKDPVIRRWVSVYPGERFNYHEWERSQGRIRASRFFELSTLHFAERPRSDEEESDLQDLYVTVEEGTTGNFSVGGSFSSIDSFAANFSLQFRNFDLFDPPRADSLSHFFGDFFGRDSFRGAGQELSISLQPGVRRSTYALNFADPFFLERDLTFDFGVARSMSSLGQTFDQVDTGFRVGLGKYFTYGLLENFTIKGLYGYSVTDIRHVSFFAPLEVRQLKGATRDSSFTGILSYDVRDNIFAPTEGYVFTLSGEIFGWVFGGDLDIWKAQPRATYYYPLWRLSERRTLVFSLSSSAGWAGPHPFRVWKRDPGIVEIRDAQGRVLVRTRPLRDEVPIYQRYFVGEFGSLRGFDFRGIGPRAPGGEALGGNFSWTGSAELTLPLIPEVLNLVSFYDVGVLEARASDFRWRDFRTAWGLGLRFFIPPLGPVPLALDYARAVKKFPRDREQTIHFNLGFTF